MVRNNKIAICRLWWRKRGGCIRIASSTVSCHIRLFALFFSRLPVFYVIFFVFNRASSIYRVYHTCIALVYSLNVSPELHTSSPLWLRIRHWNMLGKACKRSLIQTLRSYKCLLITPHGGEVLCALFFTALITEECIVYSSFWSPSIFSLFVTTERGHESSTGLWVLWSTAEL